MASTSGLGKVRHMTVNVLWIQHHVHEKMITLVKIKNKFNPSDLLTKHLTKAEVQQIMEYLQHSYEQGRSAAAPKLVSKEEAPVEGAQSL